MRVQSPIALTLGDELIHEDTTYAYQYQASNGEFVFQCPQSGMVHQEPVAGIERAIGEKRFSHVPLIQRKDAGRAMRDSLPIILAPSLGSFFAAIW